MNKLNTFVRRIRYELIIILSYSIINILSEIPLINTFLITKILVVRIFFYFYLLMNANLYYLVLV